MVLCRVLLLDGKDFETDISRNAEGAELFEEVCKKLNINEKEYFGLTYTGTQDVQYWVNHEKKIAKQVKSGTWVFEFAVKFYPPEPSHLSEDVTRYQLCLQIRADIYNGKLPCSFMTHAILGSYTVQAEIGDYDPKVDGPDDEYLKAFDFAPQQTPELSQKIHELHKTHKGQTPEEAELNFLENAKKLAMYGVDLHKAKDDKNQVIMLGVCSSGLQLYRDKLRINRFVWPKIIKLTYKRNNFYIKLRQTEGEQELNICFKLDSHKLAKRLWKTCVEHHTFFRLKEPEKNSTGTLIPRFNSRFRYSGRTQKQIREQEDLMDRPKVKVERRGLGNSFRMPRDAEGNIIHPHGEGQPDTYDRTDKLPGHTDTMSSGPPPYSSMDRGDKSHRKPGETEADRPDTTEDRRDKMLGNHDQTEGAPLEAGDSALLEGGMALQGNKKSKEDKEREKREKEEEKQRKKDAEKERKRLEKEKKKHKDTAEDRTDRMGDENATETAINGPSDSMGLDSDALLLGKPGSNAPKSDGSENPPKEGENLELVKSDKAHDKYKDKKESKKGGGLFGMLKKTPSKGKGDKNKPGDANVNNRDLPTDGSTQENKIEETMAIKQKSIVPDENIEDEVFAESDSVKPVIESNSKLVNGVKERKSDKSEKRGSLTSSSSSSSEEGEMVLEHRTSNIIEEVCSGPSSPTSLGGSDNPVVVISVHNKEEESVKVEEECSVKVVNNPKDKDTASQKDEKSPVLEVKTEKIVTENEVEVKLNEKRSSNPAVSEISNTEIVASAIVNSDNTDVNVTEEKAVVQEEVCKELESPPEVPVVLTNEEAGREDVDEGSSKTEEKKVVEPTKDEKKRQKEEEKKKKEEEKKGKKEEERRKKEEERRQKEEEKKRIKQEHIERKRREREEKERKKQEKLQSKRKSVKGEVEEKQEVESQEKQAKSSPVPPAKEGKISEETKVEGKSEEQPKEMLVKIKVLPKSDTDTSILGQEVYDDKSKEKESVKETAKEEVKEKQEEGKDQKNKKSKKKKPEQKKKSSTGCFSFVRHHKSSDSEEEVARIELPTEPWPSEKQEAEEVEKSPEEPKVKTPPKQKGGVGMGWALPGLNEFKDRAKPDEPSAPITGASSSSSDEDISHHAILADDTEEQGGFGLSGTHPDYSDKSIDRKMQFIAVTPPSTEVYDRQKGDHPMPFFEPVGSTSDGEGEGTLGKKKPPPVAPKKYRDSQDDKLADIPPTVATERMRYDPNMDDRPIPTTNVPIVKTQTRTVTYEKDGIPLEIEDGILISSQSHSTRTQTIETTTYKTERDGKTETRVEKKVVISQEENGDDIDHDALLAEAIKSVTEMNPDLSVERIECMRQIEEIDGRY